MNGYKSTRHGSFIPPLVKAWTIDVADAEIQETLLCLGRFYRVIPSGVPNGQGVPWKRTTHLKVYLLSDPSRAKKIWKWAGFTMDSGISFGGPKADTWVWVWACKHWFGAPSSYIEDGLSFPLKSVLHSIHPVIPSQGKTSEWGRRGFQIESLTSVNFLVWKSSNSWSLTLPPLSNVKSMPQQIQWGIH